MRYSLLLPLILFAHIAIAQVYVSNEYSSVRDSAIFFVNGRNLLRIYVPGHKPGQLKLELPAETGVSYRNAGDTMVAEISFMSKPPAVLRVTDKHTGRLAASIRCTLVQAAEPKAQVGGIKDSVATKSQLLVQPGLVATYPNSIYKFPFIITGYVFTAYAGGSVNQVLVTGPYFTEEVKNMIRALPRNSRVAFEDIKATCPDCRTRLLDKISLLVTY